MHMIEMSVRISGEPRSLKVRKQMKLLLTVQNVIDMFFPDNEQVLSVEEVSISKLVFIKCI